MRLSRRAKRGIAIFHKIQTDPQRFKYLLSVTKRIELEAKAKEILHGPESNEPRITVLSTEPAIPFVGARRKTAAELAGVSDPEPDAVSTGEVQPSVHDVHADGQGGTPGADKSAESNASEAGPNVSERDERGGH